VKQLEKSTIVTDIAKKDVFITAIVNKIEIMCYIIILSTYTENGHTKIN
jgi:hypothetical protein